MSGALAAGRPLPVVVLGGGPSGLSCAWELSRAGKEVVVLESELRAGGLCATVERDGYRFDLGGHRFVSSSSELARTLSSLLGSDLLERERRSVVLHHGRAFRYPLEAPDLVRSLGLGENVRALGSYVRARAQARLHPKKDTTFEAWVKSRFGEELYETFFGPYTHKLWGIAPSEISSEWAEQRIGLLHLGDAALRLLGLRKRAIRTYARRYLYPRFGMGQLFTRLAEEAARAGATIRLGTRVTGFVVSRSRIVSVIASVHGRRVEIPCSSVYATIPLPDVARFVREAELGTHEGRREAGLVNGHEPGDETGDEMASRLKFRALRFVNLALRSREVSPNTWMYVADPRLTITRIQEPRHRSPEMAPPNCTSLMLEIPCDVGDEAWCASEATLIERGLRELETLGYDVRKDVVFAFTVSVAHGYPIYRVGYEVAKDALLARTARVSNLLLGGRQGLFRYIFLDAAMEMGTRAARQFIEREPKQEELDRIQRESVLLEGRATTA